jgi:hypothetical protein
MNNPDNPEVLAVIPLPSAEDRRRREVLLARLMLVATDLVVSGQGIGSQSARDLVREIKHTFPELRLDYVAADHGSGTAIFGRNGNPL